jgi:hypothetical protein
MSTILADRRSAPNRDGIFAAILESPEFSLSEFFH